MARYCRPNAFLMRSSCSTAWLLAEPVAVDDYSDDRTMGGFLVIDPATGATLAAGMVGDPLTQSFDPSI